MPAESAILFHVGRGDVTPADIIAFADGRYRASLDPDDDYTARIERGAELLQRRVGAEGRTRPVTSELVSAALGTVPRGPVPAPGRDFVQHYACGVGPVLSDREAAAVVAARLASLSRGFSGVRRELLTRLCDMLNLRVLPRIPHLGSAGANADLVPLSYLAAAITGTGDVSYLGRIVTAEDGLRAARLEPLELRPKEALAVMSGTGLMTALGCIAWDRARRLSRFAAALATMTNDVTQYGVSHLDPRIDGLKPHPGLRAATEWLREDSEYARRKEGKLAPAPPLLRAAGNLIGTQLDAQSFVSTILETELNSVCDEPIVHPATGEFLLGGNFYGGSVALAIDTLKSAVFSTAAYLERLLVLVCDGTRNGGLAVDLAPDGGSIGLGFGAMRGVAAALVAETAMLAAPATVHARLAASESGELASMGTHAARGCLTVLDRAETVAAVAALALCQAVDLREGQGCHRRSKSLYGAVRQLVPRLQHERAQDRDITSVLELFRAGLLPLGQLT